MAMDDKMIVRKKKEFRKESLKQLRMIYPTVCYVLWNKYGWKRTKIMRLLNLTGDVWNEVANCDDTVLRILERETGIEIVNPDCGSYHDYSCLCGIRPDKMDKIQFLNNISIQTKWLPQKYLSVFCICLHRKYGWGYNRLTEFARYIEEVRSDCGNTESKYKMLMNGVDITYVELTKMVI